MKKRYWGFNWEVSPFTGQFGLFFKTKKGWRYFGIPFPFCLLAIFWFAFSDDKECIIYEFNKPKVR